MNSLLKITFTDNDIEEFPCNIARIEQIDKDLFIDLEEGEKLHFINVEKFSFQEIENIEES